MDFPGLLGTLDGKDFGSELKLFLFEDGKNPFEKEGSLFAMHYLLVNADCRTFLVPKFQGPWLDPMMVFPIHKIRKNTSFFAASTHYSPAECLSIFYEGFVDLQGVEDARIIEARKGSSLELLSALENRGPFVENALQHCAKSGVDVAALLVDPFSCKSVPAELERRRVSFEWVRPTFASSKKENLEMRAEKSKLLRRVQGDKYVGKLLSCAEEMAFDKFLDRHPEFDGFAPTAFVGSGCYKKALRLEGPGGKYALKVVDLRNLSDRAQAFIRMCGYSSAEEAFAEGNRRLELLARVNADNLCLSVGEKVEDCYIFVEPLCDSTLKSYAEEGLSSVDAARLSVDLLAGLVYMHKLELCHGDVHPDNILILDNQAMLSDFDLCSSMTGESEKHLVPHAETRAPELWYGSKVSQASDIWSFWVNVYFMRFGEMPFSKGWEGSVWEYEDLSSEERDSYRGNVLRQIEDDVHFESVKGRIREGLPVLAPILLKCAERDPAKRFSGADELFSAYKALKMKICERP